jgi:hypothetical protein
MEHRHSIVLAVHVHVVFKAQQEITNKQTQTYQVLYSKSVAEVTLFIYTT